MSVTWNRLFQLVTVLLGLGLLLDLGTRWGAEFLWFQEVDYLSVFLLKFGLRLILFGIVTGLTALYLLGNLALAYQWRYPDTVADLDPKRQVDPVVASIRVPASIGVRLPPAAPVQFGAARRLGSLLPLTLVLSLLVGGLLIYYGQTAWTYWHTGPERSISFISRFTLANLQQTGSHLLSQVGWLTLIGGLAIALLIHPRLLQAIAVVFSILFGWLVSTQWAIVAQYWHSTPFNQSEPLFGRDLSFYIFSLPLWELLEQWLVGLCLYGFVSVALTYLLSSNSLSQGYFPGFSPVQQRHLYALGGGLLGAIALSYWLSRYELLYSPRGVAFGASYTDANVQLPFYTVLSLLALAIAGYLLWRTVFWRRQSVQRFWLKLGLGLFSGVVGASLIVPTVVQSLVVQPNELDRERPYIERTIALTRQAFGLTAIDAIRFDPQGELTEADLVANDLTIRNIRLWDERPLLETNRQLQQIRPYYRFPAADIDRYTLQTDAPSRRVPTASATSSTPAPTEQRQVLIAARELDYSAVPQEAQTWVNRHLIYTHGYGFTLSPVNTVGPGGLPEYFVKDITGGFGAALTTSSPAIRASIPIGQPRIYYGEITNTYVMTHTQTRELDYPSGSDNAYNVYAGRGGVNIGSWWRRGLFAVYLRDWRVLFTRDFLPETKVLFRRNINHRIQAIAPFLRYDSDPYLVTARVGQPGTAEQEENYLYWIVDAYTTSDRYPYSDLGRENINYIRNSVKVVIDAYHGSVDFYVADPLDPMIQTWSAIFPGLFKPLDRMPPTLRSHLRYPVDFFKLQSERLLTYHMIDPQVFYNREDQWQIPDEVYGDEARPVEPYYLITSLPIVPFEEFILLLPYTPRERTNLIAWLAARSDGENYGKLLLYTFPKERLVYGPAQIEARINQDPVISQQISLWNRQGSRAIQGNLLIVPIERSLLYVEPLYLEASQNSLPTLVRVIVAYENRIVMAPTLEESLQAIFRPQVTPDATIIRPVE